ncbi:MAG: hypothetical protein EZS28_009316 [Streblomastix strix]|uniref:Uncharacterized protein n=1 Tax=Streblomastix strix TaxID=222440 RepID=A0A5J4WJV0_9EUKA|nr:MAG: hypothetical protein EZS28_009316 [Streblomastix strix]
MEWLDSLTCVTKYTNQYPKQQQVQFHSQQDKLWKQKEKAKNNQQVNLKESQLMELMTMETVINLNMHSNPSISQTETMDSERMTAGRSYRPLSTEKRIPRSISQKYPPTLHLTIQTDKMDLEETVAGRGYRQQPMQMDKKTTRQSITLAMKTITSKQMIIESEDNNNKTSKDQTTKSNINKTVQLANQERQDHLIQPIQNKNQEIQTLHNLKANLLQLPHLQNQDKQKEKLQYLNRRYNNQTNTILEAKTGQLKSVSNKSLLSTEARANYDTSNHFTPQQEQIKKTDVVQITENKSEKRSKGNKTSAVSKKQKQGFNSDNQTEIVPDSETDQPNQLD